LILITPLASGSRGNCYHVTDGVTPILLECGIHFSDIQRKTGFNMSSIAGCLVTHEHLDHSKAAKIIARVGIDVYASGGTFNALNLEGHRFRHVIPLKQFHIGTWTVLPFPTEHDAAEPLGFLLANQAGEKLLFATDTFYLKYRFQGLTHVMVETNYSTEILQKNVAIGEVPVEMKKRIIRSHMNIETTKDFLKANDLSMVREIHLLHLSDQNSDAAMFKRQIQELTGKEVYIAGER